MKLAFTICSNNYLAQAAVLAKSFLKHNPDFEFYIGLADKLSNEVDYEKLHPAIVLPVEDLRIASLEELVSKFRTVEFNTAVKPSYLKYFINNLKAEFVFYLDPDLCFYADVSDLIAELKNKDIILTPHILSPIPLDDKEPGENMFLKFGVYNLGFIGLYNKGGDIHKFLDWWEQRTFKFGFYKPSSGFFTDQLWINLVPIFFKNVSIIQEAQYNMAPWNLHERFVEKFDENGSPYLSNGKRLVFYHFSSFNVNSEYEIKQDYDRYTLKDFPHLKVLYSRYRNELIEAGYLNIRNIKPALGLPEVKRPPKTPPTQLQLLRRRLKSIKKILSFSFC